MIQPIPWRIRVGVTGHRSGLDRPELIARVGSVLADLVRGPSGAGPATGLWSEKAKTSQARTPVRLTVVTPLAEGADRLVAKKALELEDTRIEAVLPLAQSDYLEDFATAESRREFESLLARAARTINLRDRPLNPETDGPDLDQARRQAYADVGQYVIEQCDVLLALWDGRPARGQGGTAEVVQAARARQKPLVIISTIDDREPIFEKGNGLDFAGRADLEALNRANVEKEMNHDVFISHSSQDKAVAEAVCANLESQGITCWIAPRDVLPGVEYAEGLLEAIITSRMFVLILSEASNASPQVLREVEIAVSKGIPILPLRIDNVTLSRSMEYYISTQHWLDASKPPVEAHFPGLAAAVSRHLDRPESQAAKVETPAPPPPSAKGRRIHPAVFIGGALAVVAAVVVVVFVVMIFTGPTTRPGTRSAPPSAAVAKKPAAPAVPAPAKVKLARPKPVAAQPRPKASPVRTPTRQDLLRAVFRNDAAAIKSLAARGVDVNAPDQVGRTALHLAADRGHLKAAQALLAAGAKSSVTDRSGLTPLHLAALRGRAKVVSLLLAQRAGVNGRTRLGLTPLHLAARGGFTPIVQALLAKGAQVNAQDRSGRTPLHMAAERGRLETARALLAKGAKFSVLSITDRVGMTPLHLAVLKNRAKLVSLFLNNGADVNDRTKIGLTPLHLAAQGGSVPITRALLAKGAKVNAGEARGQTPLHLAAWRGRVWAARALLAKGADVKATDKAGLTPLHMAVLNRHPGMVKLLMARGAQAEAKDNSGRTPLSIATRRGNQNFIKLLQEAGPK
jgi:ankyrin repeat protein